MAKKKKVEEVEGDASKKGKKSKKKLMAIAVLLIVVIVAGYVYMGSTKKPEAAANGETPTTVTGMLIGGGALTVNLRDGHYLQFKTALLVPPGGDVKILSADRPVLLDILNTQAAAMTEPELLAPGGKATLKANIVKAINQEWPGLVTAVYFEQFTMQ